MPERLLDCSLHTFTRTSCGIPCTGKGIWYKVKSSQPPHCLLHSTPMKHWEISFLWFKKHLIVSEFSLSPKTKYNFNGIMTTCILSFISVLSLDIGLIQSWFWLEDVTLHLPVSNSAWKKTDSAYKERSHVSQRLEFFKTWQYLLWFKSSSNKDCSSRKWPQKPWSYDSYSGASWLR